MITDLDRLMAGQKADLCFTDSPYNVDYAGGVGAEKAGKGRRILNDALGDGFERFLYDACVSIIAHTAGAIYMCMSSSELHTLQKAFVAAGGHWSTFIIWAKDRFTLGRSDYQRQFEPILYGWPEGAKHHWCGARDQGDVWFIDRPSRNDLHPTMKPVGLVERAIRNSSPRGGLVLDPFGGSGTTLIAAERTGRAARLIELDPRYCDVIVQRWQNGTGRRAIGGWWRDVRRTAREQAEGDVSKTPLFDATGVLAPELLAPNAPADREMTSDDLELGKAAEHLVCADLIMQGYRAFLSDQGLPYDILVDVNGAFVRVQVKATRRPKNPSPRDQVSKGYFFSLRRAGKGGRRRYPVNAFDVYALVAMDRQAIAYLAPEDCQHQSIALRVPGQRYCQNGPLSREFGGATFKRALQLLLRTER